MVIADLFIHTLMVRLPDCLQAVVPLIKVENYPLNYTHHEEKSNAVFFCKFGYSLPNTRQPYHTLKYPAYKNSTLKMEGKTPF